MPKYDQSIIDKYHKMIDDSIDNWHHDESISIHLFEYLNMTEDQYEHFVRNPDEYIAEWLGMEKE